MEVATIIHGIEHIFANLSALARASTSAMMIVGGPISAEHKPEN